jgi:hypothetical protein
MLSYLVKLAYEYFFRNEVKLKEQLISKLFADREFAEIEYQLLKTDLSVCSEITRLLIPSRIQLLGFHTINKNRDAYYRMEADRRNREVKNYNYLIYYTFQNCSVEKYFESPWADLGKLIYVQSERFNIRVFYSGQYDEYLGSRGSYGSAEGFQRDCVALIEGFFIYDGTSNTRKIHLTNVYTDPVFKGAGIAGTGIEYLKKIALERRINHIYGEITYNSDHVERMKLASFYERSGFDVSYRKGESRLDTFRMELDGVSPAIDFDVKDPGKFSIAAEEENCFVR